jgi:MSHA biogenesis protein MshJ
MSRPLPQFLVSLNARYAALSVREKRLVAAAVVIVPLLVCYSLLIDPQFARAKALGRSIVQQSAALTELQGQAVTLQQQLQIDPDAGAKAELASLKLEQERLDGELRKLNKTLVRPEEMNGLLESLLARHAGLRLLSLKTLAPQSVLGASNVATDKAPPAKVEARSFDLYRHGVEIRLEGSFGELQAYLVQLEALQQRLLWGQLQYKVTEYPTAEMSLMVYTLSPDRTWLAL